ncbi:MAG: hypothetical protein EOO88_55730, partial [Pedobacter sp.]
MIQILSVLALVICNPLVQIQYSVSSTVRNSQQDTMYSLLALAIKNKMTVEQGERLKFITSEKNRISKEAQQLVDAKKYDKAISKYKEMFKYEPAYTYAYTQMADVRFIEGNTGAAIILYHQGQDHVDDAP